jgi:hypothetical protein
MINVNSELISDYLMIQANGTILGNFKYGKINHWKSTPSSQLKRCNINVNFVKLDGRQSKTNDMSFYNIVSRFGGDDITRYRNLF